jgi:hypothetical protein
LLNALLLGLDGFTNIRQTDLPGTQALSFDYLNDMEFETRVKPSSGF